ATQERTDAEADATVLENDADDLRAQAAKFAQVAKETKDPVVKQEYEGFARDVQAQALNNDEHAKVLREAAGKLEVVIEFEQRAIQFHLDMAAKLKAALAAGS